MALLMFVLSAIGLMAVATILYYWYLSYKHEQRRSAEEDWPTPTYMKNIGAKCPTGWEHVGFDEDTRMEICRNVRDIPISEENNPSCYSDIATKTQQFTELKNWPLRRSERQSKLQDRCEFVRKCGKTDGLYATWYGIADLC